MNETILAVLCLGRSKRFSTGIAKRLSYECNRFVAFRTDERMIGRNLATDGTSIWIKRSEEDREKTGKIRATFPRILCRKKSRESLL
jgi:hypothetical protein